MNVTPKIMAITFVISSLHAETTNRSFEELEKAMEEAAPSWKGKEGYVKLRRKFVDTWSEQEIVTAGKEIPFVFNEDRSDPVVIRWGKIDHEAALKFYLGYAEKEVSKMSDHRRSLRETPQELGYQLVGICLARVLFGWAENDPKAAWQYWSDPNGPLRKKEIWDNWDTNSAVRLMAYLAKKDPGTAWQEFVESEHASGFDGPMRGVLRQIIVEGLAAGLPKRTRWEKLFAQLPKVVKKDESGVIWVVRKELLGRWMEDEADAAEKWFNSESGELVSKEMGYDDGEIFGVGENVEKAVTLAHAVGFWIKRDPDAATKWLKGRSELVLEILQHATLSRPSSEERRMWRKVLVSSLNSEEREKLVGGMLDRDSGWGLDALVGERAAEERRKEIRGVKVSEILEERVWKALE